MTRDTNIKKVVMSWSALGHQALRLLAHICMKHEKGF
jgi:hypothetical protein